jgi:phosphonate transport system ATP-binding protein
MSDERTCGCDRIRRASRIVADEPVASLDPSTSTGVLDLLHGIARSEGVAVVCSLHQVHLARAYADRIVGLSGGRVVFDLPAARLERMPSNGCIVLT